VGRTTCPLSFSALPAVFTVKFASLYKKMILLGEAVGDLQQQ
jgi:hypothetical protein